MSAVADPLNRTSQPPLLKAQGLCKSFSGVTVLENVGLTLAAGEVLAVIGENGAGKSTLMKILAGVLPMEEGRLQIQGRTVRFANPRSALESGVVLIHQELNLCDNLSVAENIFLGREPQRFGFLNSKSIEQQSALFLAQVGLNVSPRALVKSLPIGKQQMVEIAKALSIQAKVLIFDEPTSSLSAAESESLFHLVERLKQDGVGIIYISHRLTEVRRLADRALVLRDGVVAGELDRASLTLQKLVSLMVGRDISNVYQRTRHRVGEPLLEVSNLVTTTWPEQPVSFQVRAGEILGIAGLVGSGRTELLETLFGIQPPRSGEIRLGGKPVRLRSPADALKLGIALVPEDRKKHGLITELDVRHNIGLAKLKQNQLLFGFANFALQKREVADTIDRLRIKTANDRQLAKFLSGGNQQKIVIGKWLTTRPKVLLLDEPTRGIDIGAKQEIYSLIEQLAAESMAIICVSSELEEIIGLSDRVLVMREGGLAGELEHAQLTEEAIMQLATI